MCSREIAVEGSAWGTTDSIVYVGFGIAQEDLEASCIDDFIKFQKKKAKNQEPIRHLDKALLNKGIHAMGPRFILSIAHSEEDIQETVEKFDQSLKELTTEGLLVEFS